VGTEKGIDVVIARVAKVQGIVTWQVDCTLDEALGLMQSRWSS
jgi:hypothetical protein